MAAHHVLFNDFVEALNSTLEYTSQAYDYVPGSAIVWRYIQNSYQNDPFRVGLELLLLVFAVQYLMHKKKRPRDDKMVKLTEKEIEELVDEWQPEPLVPSLSDAERLELEKIPIIVGPQGPKPRIKDAKALINLASYNFLGLASSENVKTKAISALRKYGVGSCGPPGFYGTIDVHMDLEKQIADFLGTEEAIIYSQGFSTISSVIPAFSKRGDIIVCDEGVSFAIQKGVQISRSVVRRFKHNDMEDLERVLEEIETEALKKKSQITRRFIVVEGLYLNYGDIAPLPRIIELKKKYKYRLILDETVSFGTLGSRGAGVTDYYSVPITDVEFIVGSLCHSLCSSGGFCAGSHIVCDHQRLAGLSYCFSASIPALLAVAASEAIHQLQLPATGKSGETSGLKELKENTTSIRNILANAKDMVVGGSSDGPIIHLRLKKDAILEKDAMALDLSSSSSSAAAAKAKAIAVKRLEEERVLQDIVDEAAKDGVLLTRAKYLWDQEVNPPAPSIRICASAALTKRESEKAATVVKSACSRVLGRRR